MKKIIVVLIVIGCFSIADAQNIGVPTNTVNPNTVNPNTINTNIINTNNDPSIPATIVTPTFADSSKTLYPNPTNTASINNQTLYTLPNDVKGIKKDSLQKQKRDHR